MYRILLSKEAQKTLRKLPEHLRFRFSEIFLMLEEDPSCSTLNIRKLKGSNLFRVRSGDWRIIFERRDIIKILYIVKIGTRGDIYK